MTKIETKSFGSPQAKLFTLQNENGVKVCLTNFGARIVEFWAPVEGKLQNIAFGYASDEEYLAKDTYLGAIVGPVAGRISGGKTTINGKEYTFPQNEKGNTLHGGPESFEVQYWGVEPDEEKNAITFSLDTKDGYNGFPGSIHIQVNYQLTEENELIISYYAQSDKDTLFNPTNHVYFNLNGNPLEAIDHQLVKINADSFVELGEGTLPTGKLLPVAGTSFDFREVREFRQGFESTEPQNKLVNGFDHPWVLNKEESPQVEAWNTAKTLKLEVRTDRSAVVIYTYNAEPEPEKQAVRHGAFTMETQELPDASNIDGFGNIILNAGETFESQTSFKILF